MKIINPKSRQGIINLFADYIVTTIGDNIRTMIEVTDCNSFFVVNGITESMNVINFDQLIINFKKEFSDFIGERKINVIDVIKYDTPIDIGKERWFRFYFSERSLYSDKTIKNYHLLSDDNINYINEDVPNYDYTQSITSDHIFTISPMVITSEFPFGYSKNVDRDKLYYCEYICNHLFNQIYSNKIDIKYSNVLNSDDDFNIEFLSDGIFSNEQIKSLILDVFDFDLTKFRNLINDYNIMDDLLKPLDKKPWMIKDKYKELTLIIC